MQCRVGALLKFHHFLKEAIAPHIVGQVEINQKPEYWDSDRWTKVTYNGALHFYLWNKPIGAQAYSPDGSIPIHQLSEVGDENTPGWMSWREQWSKARGGDVCEMIESALVFYWGPRTQLEQLFRAEWSAEGKGSKEAGHPHWHYDCASSESLLSVSGIHLGMAGWTHPGEQIRCWQKYADTLDAIHEWASKTVVYCRDQLRNFPPK